MSYLKLDDFVATERYPIHQPESPECVNLIADCHRMIRRDSICTLPRFLRSGAVQVLANEISDLEPVSRKIDFESTAYGWMENSGFPDNHPRSRLFTRRCSAFASEQFSTKSLCTRLFQFDEITDFVRRLLRYETLYRSECPNISVRINIMARNDVFGWHYDTNDGVVSFCIQNADEGGVFEYAPLIRSESDEN